MAEAETSAYGQESSCQREGQEDNERKDDSCKIIAPTPPKQTEDLHLKDKLYI